METSISWKFGRTEEFESFGRLRYFLVFYSVYLSRQPRFQLQNFSLSSTTENCVTKIEVRLKRLYLTLDSNYLLVLIYCKIIQKRVLKQNPPKNTLIFYSSYFTFFKRFIKGPFLWALIKQSENLQVSFFFLFFLSLFITLFFIFSTSHIYSILHFYFLLLFKKIGHSMYGAWTFLTRFLSDPRVLAGLLNSSNFNE